MIDKTYQPSEVEGRIYRTWEQAGAFRAGRPERAGAKPYSIVIPPPNVTGSLHMGHALNNTLQDILCRFERMRGKDVLWQPGTDHAGIATQMVVERQLMERQQPGRREMGREAFLKRVWEWKGESGGTIVNQLKRLGASCDWSRERFTMDEGLSKAVLKVFVELHREGLIYKDKRLVNWDPKLLTAISDLEVVQVETRGHLWHLRYPIEGKTFDPNDPSTFIVVATTRPETMLGDTAVAVHPDDERYKKLVGKNVILPLVGRKIPIIADEYSDPEKGSGAVKITPAHDFNDFEVGKRHKRPLVNVFTTEAKLNLKDNEDFLDGVPKSADLDATLAMHGADRFVARKQIVARLEEKGMVEKIEPHSNVVPHGDRSNVVIEPFLTDQWYVNAQELAKPAIAAVRAGKTKFIPKNWETTYFNWMENIQPWCISRQLWWGHQIPAWYGPDDKAFVALSEADAQRDADKHYGKATKLTRDEDVLDTWFSSALWPFSTLGWPDKTPELGRFYPTATLVTGFDIIFFWVARMMMMGLHFMPDVPFTTSTSIASCATLPAPRCRSRKAMSSIRSASLTSSAPTRCASPWRAMLRPATTSGSVRRTSRTIAISRPSCGTRRALSNSTARRGLKASIRNRRKKHSTAGSRMRLRKPPPKSRARSRLTHSREAAGAAYRFVWNVYCDWYVELSKPLLTGADGPAKTETRAMAAWALDEILRLLHPFMPFITEELWAVTAEQGPKRSQLLALSDWPKLEGLADEKAEAEIGWVIELITAIRSIRAEMNITAAIPLVLAGASAETAARAERWAEFIKRLARVSEISSAPAAPQGSVQLVVRGEVAALPLKGVIDLAAERARLAKEMQKAEADIVRTDAKLNNPKFMERAAEDVVEEEKEKREEAVGRKAKIAEALERLKGAG